MEKNYICFLNGEVYGRGDLNYMHELFSNYVINCEMYGHDEMSFKIVEKSKAGNMIIKDAVKDNYELMKRLKD